jgi:hydroxymethylpyrimidine pyrophosphatase-like HAD family hydrolase
MLFAWVGGDLYASKTDLPERYYLSLGGVKEPKKLNSPDDIIPLGVKKMLWYGTPEIIEDLAAQIDPATLPGTLFVKPEPALLDFINKNASKGNALRQVAEMLGIDREEIIAIGDGCNDIPMLEFAGLSAAPATAMQEALAVADYIAPSNNENAIAHLISKFILGEEL